MDTSTRVRNLTERVGGDSPVVSHALKHHVGTELADVGLAAVAVAAVLSLRVNDEVAALERELRNAVCTSLGNEFGSVGSNSLKCSDEFAREVVESGSSLETVEPEEVTAIEAFLVLAKANLNIGSITPLSYSLGIEHCEVNVSVALETTFEVAILLGLPAINCSSL